jgi:hypothetical protein
LAANWTTDDDQYYIWNGEVRIPKTFDPTTKAAIIMLGPPGGVAQIPALVKGDPGRHAEIDSTIVLNALEYDDPTPDSATWTTITAGSDEVSPVYRLSLNLHKGSPGAAVAAVILGASDLSGVATDGYVLSKKVGSSQVEFVPQRVGDQYWPASINNTSGTDGQNRTLCPVSIPALPFAYRLRVFGQCQITGTAATRVDVLVRLNNAISGDVVARSFGQVGANPPANILVSGVAAGSASTVGRVAAGNAATLYLRAEQQASTTDSYTTSSSTTSFMVEVSPIGSVVAGS